MFVLYFIGHIFVYLYIFENLYIFVNFVFVFCSPSMVLKLRYSNIACVLVLLSLSVSLSCLCLAKGKIQICFWDVIFGGWQESKMFQGINMLLFGFGESLWKASGGDGFSLVQSFRARGWERVVHHVKSLDICVFNHPNVFLEEMQGREGDKHSVRSFISEKGLNFEILISFEAYWLKNGGRGEF